MEYDNKLKQAAQEILDTSYKLYSDVSLINSSLFKAASTLGVELPEIPQINLAMLSKKEDNSLKSKLFRNNKLFGGNKVSEEEKKADNSLNASNLSQASLSMLSKEDKNSSKDKTKDNKISDMKKLFFNGLPKIKINNEEKENSAISKVSPLKKENISKEDITVKEQRLNNIASQASKAKLSSEGSLSNKMQVLSTSSKQQEKKVSMDEKEAKLNTIQEQMPSKVQKIQEKVESPEVSPFEEISFEKQFSPQSDLQKKMFETVNPNLEADQAAEEGDEIINNPINLLLKLVKEKRAVTLPQAAQTLNVSKDLIDTWAKILSQSSLIRIRYQLMGDTILEA